MNTLYKLVVMIHIFSAIIGLGPGFLLVYIVKKAGNMAELRHAYSIRRRLHTIVMAGGTLLLLTGLAMGAIRPYLFSAGWYLGALALFMMALAMGPLVLAPRARKVKALLASHKGDDIPPAYYSLSRNLFFYEHIESSLFLAIIALMIVKPF